MAECPVCYAHIDLEEEAYTAPCFHRFCLACIQQWTEAQAAHPPSSSGRPPPPPSCPVCRTPYTHVIYDANGVTFRSIATGAPGGPAAPPLGGNLQLDAAQRRRASVYLNPPALAAAGAGDCAGEGTAVLVAARRTALRPRAPSDPEVEAWIRRELQALLLEADVELWLQQLLGVLRACSNPAAPQPAAPAPNSSTSGGNWGGGRAVVAVRGRPIVAGGRRSGRGASAGRGAPLQQAPRGSGGFGGYGDEQACLDRIEAAAHPLLAEQTAAHFAKELWGFVTSGLSVAGHDEATFGGRRRSGARGPKRRRSDSGSGSDSDGSGSGEADRENGEEGAGGGGPGAGFRGAARADEPAGSEDGSLRDPLSVWAAYGEDLAGGTDY